jgi:hypothetical protein
MAYADTLRGFSETRQLKNLMDHVAAKGTELLTLTLVTNSTAKAFLQMPTAIGSKQYWLMLCNDSSKVWLGGGLGDVPAEETELRVYLPRQASVTGYYIGGYGAISLTCYVNAKVPHIYLSSSSGGS